MIDEKEHLLVDWGPIESKEGRRTSDLGLLKCPICEDWWTSLECIGRGKLCCKKCQRDRITS